MTGRRNGVPGWIAVDWGTSRLRAWAMGPDGAVLDAAESDRGMGTLERSEFPGALSELVSPWLSDRPLRAIACGMVGSRQGWVEAPYTPVPCTPGSLATVSVPDFGHGLTVTIVGGVRQDSPADVMRGEETQIAGFLAMNPGFDGILCLPGTHTKWAQVSAGEIVSFRTFMTGETFALLSMQSVLRHSVGEGCDTAAFLEAVADTMSRPESLSHRLFSLRAEGLLQGLDPAIARSRLSGLLIGLELAGARPYWLGQDVAIVGAGIAEPYQTALAAQGVTPRRADADAATRAGLAAVHAQLESIA